MTDKSPPLLATANLTPVAPSPLHPSSPIVVPALQEQADSLYSMSSPDPKQLDEATVPPTDQEDGLEQAFADPSEHPGTFVQAEIPAEVHHSTTNDNNSEGVVGNSDTALDVPSQLLDILPTVVAMGDMDSKTNAVEDSTPAVEAVPKNDISSQPQVATEISADTPAAIASTNFSLPVYTSQTPQEQQDGADSASLAAQPQERSQQIDQDASGSSSQTVPEVSVSSEEQTTLPTQQPIVLPKDAAAISSLMAKIITDAKASEPSQNAVVTNGSTLPIASPASSLPPRPPIPQPPVSMYSQQIGATDPISTGFPPGLGPPPGIGYTTETPSGISHPPAQFNPAYATAAAPGTQGHGSSASQRWETFLQEERKYVSEAKWDRFPEGSRLFIGNLSSERVAKREVFDIFSPYGRLAQISLKQAFGFVQYHTLQEGQAAMDNLQGIEIKGRKIHLEFSRTQKKDGDGDKRGSKGKNDRRDNQENNRGKRDDYRPARQPSPRRGSHRSQNSYGDGRGYDAGYHARRGRSRSPSYGTRDPTGYRQRSPSPQRRHGSEASLDIPRRYGGDIPDVQFLLLQEVERDFVAWVQRAFVDIGLRVDVMFLNPRFPRDAVIQRQVIEGVHAVAELDFRAQQYAKISLQVFDRSAGRDNVRFDQYQDLDPPIAAQLVARAKSHSSQYAPSYGGGHYQSASHYSQPGPPAHVPPAYGGQSYPPAANPGQPYSHPAQIPNGLDSATLQQILGTLQSQQAGPGQSMPPGGQIDVNALLASFGGGNNAPTGHPQQPAMGYTHGAPAPNGGDSAQHVQNIMAQLARYRQ